MSSGDSLNFFTSGNSILVIEKAPVTNLTITDLSIPGCEIEPAEVHSPYNDWPAPADSIRFNPLVVTFSVSEDLSNWFELYKWIRTFASPEDKILEYIPGNGYTDCEVLLYSDHNNFINKIRYIDCVPTSLGNIDISEEDPEHIIKKSTIEFRYRLFDIG